MSIQADLEKLASDINHLKLQHDLFFVGSIPKLPFAIKKAVEDAIKRYRNSQALSCAQRFHFNTLLSRYNVLNELWAKMLRDLEMTGKSSIFNRTPELATNGTNGEKIVVSEVISGTRKDLEKIRKLHSGYKAARKAAGNGVPFKSFISQLVRQAKSIRERTKCQDIEVKILVKDNKVFIKAKGIQ